ncbi:MAG: thioredoxin fold domain-containing protein [Candidatus Thiodiazotropha sp. LLP2]
MIKQYLLLVILLLSSSISLSDPIHTVANLADLSATAQKNHVPILVVFESENCGYCIRLKQEVLEPLSETISMQPPTIMEFDIFSSGKITDFNGDRIRSRQFKERYQIFAVPTLLILDHEGNPLVDPIVGYNSREEYQALLRSSLFASYDALSNLKP